MSFNRGLDKDVLHTYNDLTSKKELAQKGEQR